MRNSSRINVGSRRGECQNPFSLEFSALFNRNHHDHDTYFPQKTTHVLILRGKAGHRAEAAGSDSRLKRSSGKACSNPCLRAADRLGYKCTRPMRCIQNVTFFEDAGLFCNTFQSSRTTRYHMVYRKPPDESFSVSH